MAIEENGEVIQRTELEVAITRSLIIRIDLIDLSPKKQLRKTTLGTSSRKERL